MNPSLDLLYAGRASNPSNPSTYNNAYPYAISFEDGEFLYERVLQICLGVGNASIAETGCREGFSTSFLANAARATNGHVWTCDILDLPKAQETWAALGLERYITRGVGSSLDPTLWAGLSPPLPAALAFVFIDGLHRDDAVTAELAYFWPRLVLGGAMAFHDYNDASVSVAVNRFAIANGLVIERALNSWAGLAVLRKGVE